MPGTMRSSISITSTSAPRRDHTDPISSPIAPPPITIMRFGTCGSDSASVDEMMRVPSKRAIGSSIGALPVAMRMRLVSSVCARRRRRHRPGLRRAHLDAVRRDDAAGTAHPGDLVLLEQSLDAAGDRLDDRVLARQQLGEVELHVARDDAVRRQLMGEGEVALARLEQRLARDAADVQAGAAERGVLLDAGDAHAELGGADGGDVAARSGADDDQVVDRLSHGGSPFR